MTEHTAPIGPHITAAGVPEWQQLAWAYEAAAAAVDIQDIKAVPGWQEQAVDKFGQAGRQWIHLFDALMTIRFGPQTAPAVAPAAALDQALPADAPTARVDTAEGFARTVQHLTTTYDNRLGAAGRSDTGPGPGVRRPVPARRPRRAATAGPSERRSC